VRSAAPAHALKGLCLLLSTLVATSLAALSPAVANAAAAGPVATTTTLHASQTKANYGSATTLSVAVRRAADASPVNGTVRFYRRATTSQPWSYATSVSTSSGIARLSYKTFATYQWHAAYAGVTGYSASGSSNVTVYVVSTFGTKVVQEAARHAGAPYQWGATGPTRFDCSGYTRYVFSRFGKTLPHNSAQQYSTVHHISKSSMRVGDLLFFYSSSGIHHVGIYAGNGYMWHEPKSGDVVRKARIYSSSYYVGRVG
jgi:cell wall-associated NlpC family hydrolase